jgi:hypothetical protein
MPNLYCIVQAILGQTSIFQGGDSFFWLQKSLGGFGSGHYQGQGTPPGPKGTYRGTYRSPTNTALTSVEFLLFDLRRFW